MTGPIAYFHVDGINGTLVRLVDAGAETVRAVNDVGGGRLIAWVATNHPLKPEPLLASGRERPGQTVL